MFKPLTTAARNVVVFSREEAHAFSHPYVGTEHILLGLLRDDDGLAADVLESLGITVERVRRHVASFVGHGDSRASGRVPLTPRATEVLELAYREGDNLGADHIGTDHILLGLLRANEGVALRILRAAYGIDAARIRRQLRSRSSTPPGTDRSEWQLPAPR